MLAIWWEKDLKTAEISKNPQTIDDVMVADVLGKLSPQPTPKDVALAVAGTRAGLFLAVRLGVTPNLLQNIASENPADIEAIWQTAIEIWQETEIGRAHV